MVVVLVLTTEFTPDLVDFASVVFFVIVDFVVAVVLFSPVAVLEVAEGRVVDNILLVVFLTSFTAVVGFDFSGALVIGVLFGAVDGFAVLVVLVEDGLVGPVVVLALVVLAVKGFLAAASVAGLLEVVRGVGLFNVDVGGAGFLNGCLVVVVVVVFAVEVLVIVDLAPAAGPVGLFVVVRAAAVVVGLEIGFVVGLVVVVGFVVVVDFGAAVFVAAVDRAVVDLVGVGVDLGVGFVVLFSSPASGFLVDGVVDLVVGVLVVAGLL